MSTDGTVVSDRKRVLIVGTGSIGERHLRCFQSTQRAEVSFVEVQPALAEQIRQRYPETVGYPTLAAALEHPWDAAVIATPAPLHLAQSFEFVQRSIPVLIEKPLSVELDGVEELRQAIQRTRCPVGVAYVYRAHPVVTAMRNRLLTGELGQPVELIAVCGQHFPTYRPAYADIYYARREAGGGAVQDALTHIVNLGEWLVGPVDRLVADYDHLLLPRVDVEDTVHVLARHGRVLANYSLNQHQAPNELTVTVVCERGTVRFENHFNRWRLMQKPGGEWIDSEPYILERDQLFIAQANAFLDVVEGIATPLCSFEAGLSTLLANRAILKSGETASWQTISQQGGGV